MRMEVISPDGEPFEVLPKRARTLVIEKGWTLKVGTDLSVPAPTLDEAPEAESFGADPT